MTGVINHSEVTNVTSLLHASTVEQPDVTKSATKKKNAVNSVEKHKKLRNGFVAATVVSLSSEQHQKQRSQYNPSIQTRHLKKNAVILAVRKISNKIH